MKKYDSSAISMGTYSLKNYLQSTRTGTYGFLASLPLLLVYEFLILAVNPKQGNEIRVGADIWIKQFLGAVGVGGQHALVLATLTLGLIIFYNERKKEVVLKFTYFFLLFFESIFYSIFLAVIISNTVGYVFGNLHLFTNLPLQIKIFMLHENFWLQIALSIGAGLYEELFFRVLLVSGLFFIFKKTVFLKQNNAYLAAVLIAALLFSAVHYVGPFGDVFTVRSFTFRFLFGLAFNILYAVRGFGLVAWSHAMYDVLLTINSAG